MTNDATPAAGDSRDTGGVGLRGALKLAGMLAVSAVLMPLQAVVVRCTRGPGAFALPRFWHRCLCAILGIRVEVIGKSCPQGATWFVGNHISHFDILLIGSVLRARFIAKDDMQQWPGIPFIASLQQTVFISRRARDAGAVAAQIGGVMARGHDLVLFAEGTTSDGTQVAPFKSSLFSLVTGATDDSARWTVQPFTIELRGVDRRPLRPGTQDRDLYAYHGEMDAGAHVRRFLRSHGASLRLHLHAPIAVEAGTDRKRLAAQTHAVVASGLPVVDVSGNR